MNDEDHYWFKVADILQFKEQHPSKRSMFKYNLHQLQVTSHCSQRSAIQNCFL